MKASSALVLHYNPISLYPPAESAVRFLEHSGCDVRVVTTQIPVVQSIPKLWLLFQILSFNLRALFAMVSRSIDLLVIYEHLSILPLQLCRLLHPDCKIWVHFHEYSSPMEVKRGGLYSRYCWLQVANAINHVSLYTQTNAWRLDEFRKDFSCSQTCAEKGRFIPNTPPQHWIDRACRNRRELRRKEGPLRLVYHGAVHPKSTYIVELYQILSCDPGKYRLDIYSRDEIVDGFNEDVHWHDPIPFDDLADVLPSYDIGLILYKGHIANYVYNVPNKFWEYQAAGLGVMMPSTMNFDLVPKTLWERTVIFDFEGCKRRKFDEDLESLTKCGGQSYSVQSFEFHFRKILETIGANESIDTQK